METKKLMIAAIVFLGMGMAANAQENEKMQKRPQFNAARMDSMQCHRMVDELMLNDATTAKFETLYMNYLTEMRTLRAPEGKMNKGEAQQEAWKEQSDADVQKMLEDRFDKELKMVNLRMKYYKEFKRILSPKQIVRIFQPGFGDRNMMHQPFFANKGGRMMPQGGQQNMKWNKQNRQDKQEFPQQPITTDKN
jgi:hypothetical protein